MLVVPDGYALRAARASCENETPSASGNPTVFGFALAERKTKYKKE
jgi:hypothetical protein